MGIGMDARDRSFEEMEETGAEVKAKVEKEDEKEEAKS